MNVSLDLIGYVPDVPQSPETLLKLKVLYGPIPAIIFWTGAAIFLMYPITKKAHKLMLDQIAKKTEQ